MLSIMVGDDGRIVAGETLIGPDWVSRAAWDHVLAGIRARAAEVGCSEFMVCEGDATQDALGDLAHRGLGIWHTIYHEKNGVVLQDNR